MIDNFVDIDFILSFTGMILVVSLLTQFTKNMFDKWFENRTKYVVYGWSLFLSILAGAWLGSFDTTKAVIETVVVWFINSVIVWLTAMKGYEEVHENFTK